MMRLLQGCNLPHTTKNAEGAEAECGSLSVSICSTALSPVDFHGAHIASGLQPTSLGKATSPISGGLCARGAVQNASPICAPTTDVWGNGSSYLLAPPQMVWRADDEGAATNRSNVTNSATKVCFGHWTGSSRDRVCRQQQMPLSVVQQRQPLPKLLTALFETRGAGQCGAFTRKTKTQTKMTTRGAVQQGAAGLGCRRQTPCISQAQVCQAEKTLLLQWYTIAQ